MSYLPSQRHSLFPLPLHCERLFIRQFCNPLRITRRRLDTLGAWDCSLSRSEPSDGGLPVGRTSNFHEKHFGGLSRCSLRSDSHWISFSVTRSSLFQTTRLLSAAKFPR